MALLILILELYGSIIITGLLAVLVLIWLIATILRGLKP